MMAIIIGITTKTPGTTAPKAISIATESFLDRLGSERDARWI